MMPSLSSGTARSASSSSSITSLREFSAVENVMMPLRIGGVAPAPARGRAEELLARVGLSGRMHHRPAELSGGEQQRTAVARALAIDPAVLLAR